MKTYAFFFSLFIVATSNFSQDLNENQSIVSTSGGTLYTFDKSDKSVKGTPYIVEAFLPARVVAKEEKIFNLRYNAVNDEMEIESDQANKPTINKNISGIKVTFLKENKTYTSMTYFNEQGVATTGFLIPIMNDNSKVKIFIKESIAFYEGKPAKSSYQVAKSPTFDRMKDEFYFSINNEIAKPLSSNKKDIAALFSSHEKEVLEFISSKKLNLKKQADLVILAGYLSQFQD